MINISGQFVSSNLTDNLYLEIYNQENKDTLAQIEKKNKDYLLYLPDGSIVNALEFLKLLEKGIKEL